MKRQLLQLDDATLTKIARDIGVASTDRVEMATRIAEYYRQYGLRWSDVAVRYNLTEALLQEVVQETLIDISTGEPAPVVRRLQEADEPLTRQQIEQIVRRVLKSELEDNVVKLLKRELKSKTTEDAILSIVSQALAKYHEILFTRRSTWQNQLRVK